MQTTSNKYAALANKPIRKIDYRVRAAFTKDILPTVVFFELDTSVLDGPDILAYSGTSIVQLWDKYVYSDYTDRLLSASVTRDQVEPYSVSQAQADIVFSNHDDFFTPGSGSAISDDIKPGRPFRLLSGFAGELLPQFVGINETMPDIDRETKTATFHCIDFLTYIFKQEVGDALLLTDASTGDALDAVFQSAGLLPSQFVLDETWFNRMPFFYCEKTDKVGDVVISLMAAEGGRAFLDESGMIRAQNRQNYDATPLETFDSDNVVSHNTYRADDIINDVTQRIEPLQLYENVSVYSSQIDGPTYIRAGETLEVWVTFNDPVSDLDTPAYSAEDIEGSHFYTSLGVDGTVPYTGINLDSIDIFSKAAKLTFENTGSNNGYIHRLELWGDAIRKSEEVIVESKDQDSIDDYEIYHYEPNTRYIQKVSRAISVGEVLIDDYKDYASGIELRLAQAQPARQLSDPCTVDLDGYSGTYRTVGMTTSFDNTGRFDQVLRVRKRTLRTYFILSSDSEDRSLLDSADDVLVP